MHVAPSPLELWFTEHPGPFRHALAVTAATAPPWEELAALMGAEAPRGFALGYSEPAGDPALRERVAEAYGVAPERLTLTQGTVEANWLALVSLLRPGDRVVVQTPIYPQLPCVAAALGAEVVPWRPAGDEATDLAALEALMSVPTRLVVLNSPHNPTGRVLSAAALARIARAIEAQPDGYGLVDEVYRGVGGVPLPPSATTFSERFMISDSTSKGLALPGLRVGWLVAPEPVVTQALRWREHTGLALSSASEALLLALWPHREALLASNQALVARNRALVRAWLAAHPWLAGEPAETAGCFLLGVHGRPDLDDRALAEAWYAQDRVLAIPGSTLGYAGTFRVGFGQRDAAVLEAALADLAERLKPLAAG